MKHIITILSILAAFGAHAGGKPPARSTSGPTANQHVGITNINAALSASRSSSRSASMAAGGSASALGGSAYGGLGGSLDMAGARIGSDVNVERSAAPLYLPQPTAGGIGTCPKPGFSLGGNNASGGGMVSATFGTDTTCRIGQALDLMARDPKNFNAEDRLTVACKQEDIAETQACKDLARRKAGAERAAAALEDRHGRAYLAAREPALLP